MRRALNGNPAITNPHGNPGWGYFGKHAGYDYGVNGAQVFAPEAGTVINLYSGGSGGNIIELQGVYTHRFLHLKSFNVSKGQRVPEGALIGISGATGNVTGPHLHHDVRKNGTAWNQSFSNYYDWEALIKQQGADMPTTLESAKALANMAAGRNPNSPKNIADLQKHHVGKDPNTKILEWFNSTERKNWLQAQANIQNSLNQKISEMQNVINSLSVRPTKEEYARAQAQINDRIAEIEALQKKLAEAEGKEIIIEVEKPLSWSRVVDFLRDAINTFLRRDK